MKTMLVHAMDASPEDERPSKRQRTAERSLSPSPSTSTLGIKHHELSALPLPVLLLALPNILLHPPTHRNYTKSLYLSFLAALRCLASANLDPDMECRAWTALAEMGFRMGLGEGGVESQVEVAITKGLLISQNHPTLRPYKVHLTLLSARISTFQHKLKLSQTTLKRLLTSFLVPADPPHLVYAAHLGYIASLSVPPSLCDGSDPTPTPASLKAIQDLSDTALARGHADVATLAAVLRLHALVQMGMWAEVREALGEAEERVGVPAWVRCGGEYVPPPSVVEDGKGEEALGGSEGDGRKEDNATRIRKDAEKRAKDLPKTALIAFARLPRSPCQTVFLLYTLVLGVTFHAYVGDGESAERRMGVLHEVMDAGVEGGMVWGCVEIPFPTSPPLPIKTTHPRVLMALAFLVTSVAKRDPVGRKPKRRVFAVEGVGVVEREVRGRVEVAPWASPEDVRRHFERLARIKADLVCELVSVSIMRSEFASAETSLAELIAHVRNVHVGGSHPREGGDDSGTDAQKNEGPSLFNEYAARITLLHAQLAHALGQTERAVRCYQVAAWLSRPRGGDGVDVGLDGLRLDGDERSGRGQPSAGYQGDLGAQGQDDADLDAQGTDDPWLHAAARLGEVWVKVGFLRREVARPRPEEVDHAMVREVEEGLRADVVRIFSSFGSGSPSKPGGGAIPDVQTDTAGCALSSVSSVLSACLAHEFLEAKAHLRKALKSATSSGDNHVRALVMALIAAQYVETSEGHAEAMLGTAEQIVRGLGAGVKVSGGGGGASASGGKEQGGENGQKGGEGKGHRGSDGVGNAHLRLWIGERSAELKRRAGEEEQARVLDEVNERLRGVVRGIEEGVWRGV